MMAWAAKSAGLFFVLAGLVVLASRWMQEREAYLKNRSVGEVKDWSETSEGRSWWRNYFRRLESK